MQPFQAGLEGGWDLGGPQKVLKYTSMTPEVGTGTGSCPYWINEGAEALTDVRGQLEVPRTLSLQLSGVAG